MKKWSLQDWLECFFWTACETCEQAQRVHGFTSLQRTTKGLLCPSDNRAHSNRAAPNRLRKQVKLGATD